MNTARSLPPVGGHESSYYAGGTPVGYYEKPKPAGESSSLPRGLQTFVCFPEPKNHFARKIQQAGIKTQRSHVLSDKDETKQQKKFQPKIVQLSIRALCVAAV